MNWNSQISHDKEKAYVSLVNTSDSVTINKNDWNNINETCPLKKNADLSFLNVNVFHLHFCRMFQIFDNFWDKSLFFQIFGKFLYLVLLSSKRFHSYRRSVRKVLNCNWNNFSAIPSISTPNLTYKWFLSGTK